MIPDTKALRQGEFFLRRKPRRMKATLLPRNNYASAISDRLRIGSMRDALFIAVLHCGTQSSEIRGHQRIIESSRAKFLIPAATQPEQCEIK